MKSKLATIAALLAFVATTLLASVDTADQHFARRAEGARGAKADPAQIDLAIAAYRSAIAADPANLEARWKLMRALRFKAAYTASGVEEKKVIYTAARKIGEESLALIENMVAKRGVAKNAPLHKLADDARAIPNAGEIYYWNAAVWGEWALVYGKMAAVREGVAEKIRRSATLAMLIDPKVERGGGARILGRLHDQTPHVPFITGWASEKEAVKYLSQALAVDPTDRLTKVFLAEALVAADKANRPKAVALLREVIGGSIDPAWAVEEAAAQDDARALLKKFGA